jgi:hypothetical protein
MRVAVVTSVALRPVGAENAMELAPSGPKMNQGTTARQDWTRISSELSPSEV